VWDGLKLVPVHCDYSPRNWLVEDGRNAIGVIDWERARPGYWVEDFHRMTLDHWWRRPALRDAYFDGYGREPSEKERRQAGMVSLVNAIGGVPWAIGHGDTQFEAHNRRVIATLRDVL
jgi:thiamine kinase-like enzyme